MAVDVQQCIVLHPGQVLAQAPSGNEFSFSLLVRRRVCNGHIPERGLHNCMNAIKKALSDTALLREYPMDRRTQEEQKNGYMQVKRGKNIKIMPNRRAPLDVAII